MAEHERSDNLAAIGRDPGRERRPTMADVANHVGVSRALVSIVLRGVEGASDATRQRVLEAAAELGYRPDSLAQGLRRNRSRNLGVLFSLRRPFEVELVGQHPRVRCRYAASEGVRSASCGRKGALWIDRPEPPGSGADLTTDVEVPLPAYLAPPGEQDA